MQTDDVLILLQDVAEEIIKPRFRTLAAEEIAEKNPGDLVTVADREAEVRITEALLRAYPDALVLGEEASADDPGLMASSRRRTMRSPSIPWTAPRTSSMARPTTR